MYTVYSHVPLKVKSRHSASLQKPEEGVKLLGLDSGFCK